jgi:hypothetical protein
MLGPSTERTVAAATNEMTFNTDSKYPTRRAYVVKMRGDASPDALAGRLENLVTGRQCEFASGRELLESIAKDLSAALGERLSDTAAIDAAKRRQS